MCSDMNVYALSSSTTQKNETTSIALKHFPTPTSPKSSTSTEKSENLKLKTSTIFTDALANSQNVFLSPFPTLYMQYVPTGIKELAKFAKKICNLPSKEAVRNDILSGNR